MAEFHVYSAIGAVMADLGKEGIAKDSRNQQQGYQFRGIDAIYGALNGLLSKHQLCILPRVVDSTTTERRSTNDKLLIYTSLRVEFDFVSALDGSKHTVCCVGEAMDSGDKSSNKAMSAAYKYACLQAFCIPTEGDNDADATTHEVRPRLQGGSPHPDTSSVPAETAERYATEFRTCLTSGNDLGVWQTHLDLQQEGEIVYSAAWKLLAAPDRAKIKLIITKQKAAQEV